MKSRQISKYRRFSRREYSAASCRFFYIIMLSIYFLSKRKKSLTSAPQIDKSPAEDALETVAIKKPPF
jgi:hypothetical protein